MSTSVARKLCETLRGCAPSAFPAGSYRQLLRTAVRRARGQAQQALTENLCEREADRRQSGEDGTAGFAVDSGLCAGCGERLTRYVWKRDGQEGWYCHPVSCRDER